MFAYTHLAHEERYQIHVLKKADIQQSEIARLSRVVAQVVELEAP